MPRTRRHILARLGRLTAAAMLSSAGQPATAQTSANAVDAWLRAQGFA